MPNRLPTNLVGNELDGGAEQLCAFGCQIHARLSNFPLKQIIQLLPQAANKMRCRGLEMKELHNAYELVLDERSKSFAVSCAPSHRTVKDNKVVDGDGALAIFFAHAEITAEKQQRQRQDHFKLGSSRAKEINVLASTRQPSLCIVWCSHSRA